MDRNRQVSGFCSGGNQHAGIPLHGGERREYALRESMHEACRFDIAAARIGRRKFARLKDKTPLVFTRGVLRITSLTMTYFHRRPSTIIGAKAFHGPVRDGKEWYHLAMVVRH